MGTDALFENHTIKEIQDIEKKLRNDIEKKKEELRQMVGERYRDLMDAADTITEMKEIAQSVTLCAKSIENGCLLLENSSLQNGIIGTIEQKVEKKKKKYELLYIIASQIKILMDSPYKIWSFIEMKDFVNAVSLYLLARHVHSLLNMNPLYREKEISSLFPIVTKQWIAISHFRQVLLQNCQLVLENLNTKPEEALAPLCCSCLLTNTSLQQTLHEVLNIRKNVLKSIFKPEKYAKLQICEFVTVVEMTLNIIFILLYPEKEDSSVEECKTNLLYQEITKLISINSPGPVSLLDFESSGMFKLLPSEIKDFRPILSAKPESCSADLLQSKCNEWLLDLKESFTITRSLPSYDVKGMVKTAAENVEIYLAFMEPRFNRVFHHSVGEWNEQLLRHFERVAKGAQTHTPAPGATISWTKIAGRLLRPKDQPHKNCDRRLWFRLSHNRYLVNMGSRLG